MHLEAAQLPPAEAFSGRTGKQKKKSQDCFHPSFLFKWGCGFFRHNLFCAPNFEKTGSLIRQGLWRVITQVCWFTNTLIDHAEFHWINFPTNEVTVFFRWGLVWPGHFSYQENCWPFHAILVIRLIVRIYIDFIIIDDSRNRIYLFGFFGNPHCRTVLHIDFIISKILPIFR